MIFVSIFVTQSQFVNHLIWLISKGSERKIKEHRVFKRENIYFRYLLDCIVLIQKLLGEQMWRRLRPVSIL